ncbi:MAG: hypothetical protein LBK95_04365 [Bifidobacteriaceae bacterium]|nr:hypothetical protein [Bifidobacteriaceae bacterium]
MDDEPLILASAKRHRLNDDDILNAYGFALAYFTDHSGERPLLMLLGPDCSGTSLLEIGVVERHDYDAVCIVHAMPARPASLQKGGLQG